MRRRKKLTKLKLHYSSTGFSFLRKNVAMCFNFHPHSFLFKFAESLCIEKKNKNKFFVRDTVLP